MSKLYDIQQNLSVPNGAGSTFDPLLMEPDASGVDQPVAPDIVIPVPKAIGASAAVTTSMAVGNMTVVHNAAGAIVFDILTIRWHTMQRSTSDADEKYEDIQNDVSVPTGSPGLQFDPLLTLGGVGQVPSVVVPVPKTVPTNVTDQSFVPTVLATGTLDVRTAEAGAVLHDILSIFLHSVQQVTGAVFGGTRDQARYFGIADTGPNASVGAIYEDADDTTRQFIVTDAKVSGDGSTQLNTVQIAGTTIPTTGGTDELNLVTAQASTDSATIAYTSVDFEKYLELQQNVSVPNGAGLSVDPRLFFNKTQVMPDIVIPIPKATGIVPFVATDLSGAPGSIDVQHNGAGAADMDILFLRAHSIFRDVG